jgi:hypothetical protein
MISNIFELKDQVNSWSTATLLFPHALSLGAIGKVNCVECDVNNWQIIKP